MDTVQLNMPIPGLLHRALRTEAFGRSMTLKELVVGILQDEIDRIEETTKETVK